MKKLALALLASAALAFPALAQQQPAGSSPQGTNFQQQGAMPSAQQGPISPRSLGKQQIRRMQLSLNRRGFSPGRADGIWGPHTRSAVERFQRSKGISANGALDQQTLSDLGVKVASAAQPAQQMQTGRSVSNRTRNQKSLQKSRTKYPGSQRMKSGRSVSTQAAPKTKTKPNLNSGSRGQMNGTSSNRSNGY